MNDSNFSAATVTLNPAIDRTITIPNFTAGEVNRAEEVRSTPGGKGVNVASALADFGLNVAVTGFLGREKSAVFESLFERKKIADRFVRIAGQTRVGIKISDPARHETTDINFPGSSPAPENILALRNEIDRLTASGRIWFVLAGSVPPGVDLAIYRELVSKLRACGQRVLIDTSGQPLVHALDAAPHIVKPNLHELEELVGRKLRDQTAIVAAARDVLKRGVEMVVVSMGADGALFVANENVVTARPPKLIVRSTVGAGDALVAGIVAGMIREFPLADCARLATAFSMIALTQGESGFRDGRPIESAMREVAISDGAQTGFI